MAFLVRVGKIEPNGEIKQDRQTHTHTHTNKRTNKQMNVRTNKQSHEMHDDKKNGYEEYKMIQHDAHAAHAHEQWNCTCIQ